MNIEYKPSFIKSVKSLPCKDKELIVDLCEELVDVLEKSKTKSQGLGLKRLQKNFWEIRKGIKTRIVFRWRRDHLEFILAGSHDDIRKFLRENV